MDPKYRDTLDGEEKRPPVEQKKASNISAADALDDGELADIDSNSRDTDDDSQG